MRRFMLGWLRLRLTFTFAFAFAFGCQSSNSAPPYSPEYARTSVRVLNEFVVGVHPLHNPERLHAMFGPIMQYLEERIPGTSFRLEASRNYAAFESKLYAREFAFALPNPYQTVMALDHGYRVLAKMADDENFRGIIVVRKDSTIESVAELKGKPMSFPAPTALAATMLPQHFLQMNGVDVLDDLDVRYVGSQESSIMNVYLGHVAAGATWPPPWKSFLRDHPEFGAELKVMWETETLPNNSFVVRDDVPEAVSSAVKHLLLGLHETERGKLWLRQLNLSQFEAATDQTYAPVKAFLRTFNETVRPVELPKP
jgi:phosphonate transport system substrate-binding protein